MLQHLLLTLGGMSTFIRNPPGSPLVRNDIDNDILPGAPGKSCQRRRIFRPARRTRSLRVAPVVQSKHGDEKQRNALKAVFQARILCILTRCTTVIIYYPDNCERRLLHASPKGTHLAGKKLIRPKGLGTSDTSAAAISFGLEGWQVGKERERERKRERRAVLPFSLISHLLSRASSAERRTPIVWLADF